MRKTLGSTSEFLKHLEEILPCYYMHNDIYIR